MKVRNTDSQSEPVWIYFIGTLDGKHVVAQQLA